LTTIAVSTASRLTLWTLVTRLAFITLRTFIAFWTFNAFHFFRFTAREREAQR
jgi:hypothetical protein